MADDAMFPGPGGKSKGPPTWLLIGGAGVGIIAIVVLISRNTGGSTTAGATSIPAALGSIQEENMNLLGTVQAGALANLANFQGVNSNMAADQAQILSNFQVLQTGQKDILDAISSGNTTLLGAIQGLTPKVDQIIQLEQQLGTAEGQHAIDLQNQISALSGQVTQGFQQATASNDAQFSTLTNYVAGQFNLTGGGLAVLLRWTDEIKARLQQGDYSVAFHGPSYQPWQTASSPGQYTYPV